LQSDRDKISTMSIEEQTKRYTTRRIIELRGTARLFLLDRATEKYIARRIMELSGGAVSRPPIKEDPYISRRIEYLRTIGR
jgi:hypothetical protein